MLPLNFKYNPPIFGAIITIFASADNNGINPIKLQYRQAYERVQKIIGHSISYRDFQKHIEQMINENLLRKEDPSNGKRGFTVNLSLTDNAIIKFNLKILGIDEISQKRKTLIQLLMFFEEFVKSNPMTEKQLVRFLEQIGSSTNELQKIKVSEAGFPKVTLFKPIKGIRISKWVEQSSETNQDDSSYHIVIPGFTVEEVTSYLKTLRKGREPEPFSSDRRITDVPFVIDNNYSEEEVKEVVDLLGKNGLIRIIQDVFPGEVRYQIADETLMALIKDVWHVHLLDFRLMDENLGYNKKPTDKDRKHLSFIYGKKTADRIITLTYPTRRSYKKEIDMNKEKEGIALDFSRDFGRYRAALIQDISRSHEKVIKQKEVASELVVGILHPSSREDFN